MSLHFLLSIMSCFSSSDIGYPSDEGVRWEFPTATWMLEKIWCVWERKVSAKIFYCMKSVPWEKDRMKRWLCAFPQPHTILSSLLHLCSVVDLNFFYIVGQNKCCACTFFFFFKSYPNVLFRIPLKRPQKSSKHIIFYVKHMFFSL